MIVKINVPRVFTETIAPMSALVKMEAIAQIQTDNANVLLDGRVYCVNRLVGLDFTVTIVKINAIVKMELRVITSQVIFKIKCTANNLK